MYIPATDDFDALVYSDPHPGTMQYINQKFEAIAQVGGQWAQDFLRGARQSFDHFMGSEAMRRARAVKNKLMDGYYIQDDIFPLYTIGKVQNAGSVMQRWIMAFPEVRELYHEQRIDGYSATYVDVEPGAIRDDHYDYRRIMDGVVQDTEDGGMHIRFYVEELKESDVRMRVDQKADILYTRSAVKALLEAGREDPTSQTGGWL
jgi:hypothetical protein